jgi:hypothetical protein
VYKKLVPIFELQPKVLELKKCVKTGTKELKKLEELNSNPNPKNLQIDCALSKLRPEVFKKESSAQHWFEKVMFIGVLSHKGNPPLSG